MATNRIGNETRGWSRVNLYNQGDTGRVRETRAELAVPGDSGIK